MLKHLFKKETVKCGAVIVAAGSSNRMQGTDKIMALLHQEPLIVHTVRAFQENPLVHEIVLVTREDLLTPISQLCQKNNFNKVTMVVTGGQTRPQSVMKGLDHLSKDITYAAIHDGARPLVGQEVITNAIEAAQKFHAAAPAVPVKDTIKVAVNHIVTKTPDRSTLMAIQTPQVFDFDLLRGALQKAIDEELPITDDCSAVESIGMSVYLSQGSDENIKVTTPVDLVLAEAIINNRRQI